MVVPHMIVNPFIKKVITSPRALPIIGSGESVAQAVHELEHAGALVVLDDGRPRGVITRQDLLGYLAS